MSTVTVSDAPLSIEELLSVVDGAPIELAPAARVRIDASRALVDTALASGEPIYGLTTEVGHGKDVRLSDDHLRRQQETLVMTHAGGLGEPLPTGLVRAALVARLNGIARGGSGASMAAAEVLAGMLNAGVHPVVPETASVGAGDLAQMAGIAQVAIGRGLAEYRGETIPGGEALGRAGITPLVLEPKDGLALISANSVSIGHAALVLRCAAGAAEAADVAAALSMEATGGNPSIVLPAVAHAKPFPGQIQAADHLRATLAGSHLLRRGAAHSVQDPLSCRVVPQVHGALREYLAAARRAVEVELNAASDNPLVSVQHQALISNGNFHPMVLAIAFDALRVAVAHVGQLSERRMSHLWDAFFRLMAAAGPPSADAAPPPLYGLQLRYPAAAVFPELKQLAAPATLDTPPLEMGVEDHGTAAPLSVRKTGAALALLEDLLAIELLLARDVLATMPDRPVMGTGTGQALRLVEEALAGGGPSPADVHRSLRARLPDLDEGGAPRPGATRPTAQGAAAAPRSSRSK
jgi:histidine ammonia-lyase